MGSLPHIVEDCHGILQTFSDGSIRRQDDIDLIFKHFPVFHDDGSAVWKDYCFDHTHNLHLRLYKPKPTTTTVTRNLPIIYFLHGGGFCVGSFNWPNFHNCCLRLASGLQAIVVAPDYRLAPEHRLPAAMEDALSGLNWLKSLPENSSIFCGGVDDFDFNRVFVVGDSSGGNIAHHLAVMLGPDSPELAPVKVRGYVLMAPFFGGSVRTKSEAEGVPETLLNLDVLDMFWRLSLPIGETTDYPLANPFGPKSRNLEEVKLNPLLIMAGGSELMKDRIEAYAKRMKDLGNTVDYIEFHGKQHGFFINEPYSDVSKQVLQLITNFIHACLINN